MVQLKVPCSEVFTKVTNAPASWEFIMATADRLDTWVDRDTNSVVVVFKTDEECEEAAENLRLSGFTVERGI